MHAARGCRVLLDFTARCVGDWLVSFRENPGTHMMPDSQYRVSAVAPTFKRPVLLIRFLAALLAQDFDAADYEVITLADPACDEPRRPRTAGRVGVGRA